MERLIASVKGEPSCRPTRFSHKRSCSWRAYVTCAFLCIFTLLQTYFIVGRMRPIRQYIASRKHSIVSQGLHYVMNDGLLIVHKAAARLFGVTNHGVFLDGHFRDYDHIIAIRHTDYDGTIRWLPLTRPDGRPGRYANGRNWTFWAFRVQGPRYSVGRLEQGLGRLTAFWAGRHKVPLDNAHFEILSRPSYTPHRWIRGHAAAERNRRWIVIGTASWTDRHFRIQLNSPD